MDWSEDDSLAVSSRVMEHLRAGRLVLLPSESAYVLAGSALAPGALAAFQPTAGADATLILILGHAIEVFDWLPFFGGVGVRLARRFWPGPFTLTCSAGLAQGLWSCLPTAVQQRLTPTKALSVRLPNHAALRKAAQTLGMPLVAAATTYLSYEEAIRELGDEVGMAVRNGGPSIAQPDTVVGVHGRHWQILQQGTIPAEDVEDAAPCRILFLCTGNTCRSPLAETLCRKLLAERFGCLPEALARKGIYVQSAGLAAMMGSPATSEAVAVARARGADLGGHASQPLTIDMLLQADRIFAMTTGHLRMLQGVPYITPRLLSPNGEDIPDPIGGTPEVYEQCARRIVSCLEELVPELCEC